MKQRIQVIPFQAEHLTAAAELFVNGYRAARDREPLLPTRHEDVGAILSLVDGLSRSHSSVVALRGGRVVGFLLGQTLTSFRGKRTVYVPEWAHAAVPEGRQNTYRSMYEAISGQWVADGAYCHLVTVLANDADVTNSLFWLEFGMTVVDAIRGVAPVADGASDIQIRRAGPDDADAVVELANAMHRHVSGPPTFLGGGEPASANDIAKRLSDPSQAYWMAWNGGEPVAYLQVQGANTSAAYIINDPGTASVTGAFTKESMRGRGIGLAMLVRCVEWTKERGYVRCAVDFEPQNSQGRGFWLKHFRPVCYTVIRHVQEPNP